MRFAFAAAISSMLGLIFSSFTTVYESDFVIPFTVTDAVIVAIPSVTPDVTIPLASTAAMFESEL